MEVAALRATREWMLGMIGPVTAVTGKRHDLHCCGRTGSEWHGPIGKVELKGMPPTPQLCRKEK